MDKSAHTNRLIHETSPYLQQHAHNPVDWHPWGPEALERAKREDKPILLSIGYSACHWCHVMEHESFEDEAVAQVMNTLFVNVKVDREERPDLDKIYQTAHQLLTGRPGGWPLNMFLTPTDHMPFFGGTYFPKTQRYGMPAFTDILSQIAEARIASAALTSRNRTWRCATCLRAPSRSMPMRRSRLRRWRRPRCNSNANSMPTTAVSVARPSFRTRPRSNCCCATGRAAAWPGKPDTEALHAVRFTLQKMARGGLYDQLGGGFCRYSVDERWEIPHFEKMLYDNAQLLPLYADAWLATGDALFRRVALETGAWIMREMQSLNGGYYSTLDADSEGHEGKFYAWDVDEIKKLLTPLEEEWELVEIRYDLTRRTPNFEGHWHLNVRSESGEEGRLDIARAKLFAAREKRVHPGRDEKILTSWNGMMIRAMAHAGRLLGRQDFVDSAGRAF